MIKSNRGQLSIFMGISLVIIMGMLAFIINVGLFVKAKINLQNATDAAAFAGAATQARQLTNIAYVNWEIRNTFKEWMFKYYVLGQLGLFPPPFNFSGVLTRDASLGPMSNAAPGSVHFFLATPPISGGAPDQFDAYNVPSICIHNNSSTNICPLYSLPGIPRFQALGVAGISEIHEAFVDKLTQEKAIDCSRRSKINFATALSWAYGAGGGVDTPNAALVATNRPGAWPQALELALRMRNLEMIVNRPPVASINIQKATELEGEAPDIALNERPIKAFWSGYRNLNGGAYKDSGNDEFSNNFELTELEPQAFNAERNSLSGFLINPNFSYSSGGTALQKHYLDLQLMPVNYATMFSTFVSSNAQNLSLNVKAEATCGVSKSALPVPGYILGFNKNPEVLTYYAVKGESKFIGLFFPIGDSQGIKLTAYAAAKPFGGRIGPMLFTSNGSAITPRNDDNKRTSPYISGLKVPPGTVFKPGMPIPPFNTFWVNEINAAIGGIPQAGNSTFYALPNLIYNFDTEDDLKKQKASGGSVHVIEALLNSSIPSKEVLGLYNSYQFGELKKGLGPDILRKLQALGQAGSSSVNSVINGEDILKSIVRARRPTKYDVVNYLVPNFKEVEGNGNTLPFVQKGSPITGDVGFTYKLFAPLLGPRLLYTNKDHVELIVKDYMRANEDAIKNYLQALLKVSNAIINMPSTANANLSDSAHSIHPNSAIGSNDTSNFIPPDLPPNNTDPVCKNMSLAQQFNHFFRKDYKACGVVPLQKMIVEFIENQSVDQKKFFYEGLYYDEPGNSNLMLPPEAFMTAYFPGPRQGTGENGVTGHPLKISGSNISEYSTKRNFYSTKFFHMAKIMDGAPGGPSVTRGKVDYEGSAPALRERKNSFAGMDAQMQGRIHIQNPLKYSEVGGKPYFLDF